MSNLPVLNISPSKDNTRPKLTALNTSHNIEDELLYDIHTTPDRQHDAHSVGAGILSPTRRGTRGSVTDFAKFLKTFNKQQKQVKSTLSDYHDDQDAQDRIVPRLNLNTTTDANITNNNNSTSNRTNNNKDTTKIPKSPAVRNLARMRHTISAAAQLQQHLTATIKPRHYVEETYISAADAKLRKRLATRLHMLGFPQNPCYQALKQSRNKPGTAASLLLKWYPKGQGGRNLVKRMVDVIEASEQKLKDAHERIKSVMSDGTPSERLKTVSKFFLECDIGDKGYLTPLEFSDLSSNLGVHLSTAELREAMMLIDEDSNGKVELIEYIEWWGDEQVVDELLNKNKGENKGGDRSTWPLDGSESKSRSATKKTKKIKSRSIEMGLQEELPPLKVSPTKEMDMRFQKLSQHELGRLSPSAARNRKYMEKKKKKFSASEYLEKSMAVLARHEERKKTSNNIQQQIGMYSHIRKGGWFDKNGNMQDKKDKDNRKVLTPKTDDLRRKKATRFASELGNEVAKMNDMQSQFEEMKRLKAEEDN